MDVFVYGYEGEAALGRMCKRALEAIGHNATYLTRNKDSPFVSFLPILNESPDIRSGRLVEECAAADPDIVLIIKGYDVPRRTIERIHQQTDAIVTNWNPDNPFQIRSEQQAAETYLDALPAYDIACIWGKFLLERLRNHGARQVLHLPFGFDPALHHPTKPVPEYECDVVFLGHWSKKRQHFLSHIAALDGIDLDIWGNYWSWRCWDQSLRRCHRGGPKFGEAYSQAMSTAKIIMNVTAEHTGSAANMRTFEIPATGSLLLTTKTEEQCEFFEPMHEAVMYEDGDELARLVKHYLANDDERKAVAERGNERVQEYSYRARMERLIKAVHELNRSN